MDDLASVLSKAAQLEQAGKTYVLVTLVDLEGSSFRGLGARMIWIPDEPAYGTLSGGCLESDIAAHAEEVIEDGRTRLIHYETASDEDLWWGSGSGCGGSLKILLERFTEGSRPSFAGPLSHHLKTGTACFQLTLFRVEGDLPAQAGQRLLLAADDTSRVSVSEPNMAEALQREGRRCWAELREAPGFTNKARCLRLEINGGTLTALVEAIFPPPALILFGGGHDALPLVHLAARLGWTTTLVDHRPAWAQVERFRPAKVLNLTATAASTALNLNPRSLVLIKTHHYESDLILLRALLPQALVYLGILGPAARTQRLLAQVKAAAPQTPTDHLFSPVGLDIGAETPMEIAVSILAEMQAVLSDRRGGYLKNRKGPIHPRRLGQAFAKPT